MNNPIVHMLGLGGMNNSPTIAPELRKRLKQYHLSPKDITEHLRECNAVSEAYVIAIPSLVDGAALTPGKMYPLDEIGINEAGTSVVVTVTDDMGMRHSDAVLLRGRLSDVDQIDNSSRTLVLVLDEVRKLLCDKWAHAITKNTADIVRSYHDYKKAETFLTGDVVCYKDNMMVPGKLTRRGTAVVVEVLMPRDGSRELLRDRQTHEVTDLLIAAMDDDGDFAVMPVSSKRLKKVPMTHVGTYKNPYALAAEKTQDNVVESDAIES